jgi:hypothetical protein
MVHTLQNGDGRQEILVSITLVLCSVFHDMVEGVAIQLPKSNIGLGHDGGGSRSIVEKGELTEDITWLVILQESLFRRLK